MAHDLNKYRNVEEEKMKGERIMFDHTVMKKMIDGKKTERKLLEKVADLVMREKAQVATFQAHFLRAVHDSNGLLPIKNIKKLMETVTIFPDNKRIDYKDDKQLMDQMIEFAQAMNKIKEMHDAGTLDEFKKKHGITK